MYEICDILKNEVIVFIDGDGQRMSVNSQRIII